MPLSVGNLGLCFQPCIINANEKLNSNRMLVHHVACKHSDSTLGAAAMTFEAYRVIQFTQLSDVGTRFMTI